MPDNTNNHDYNRPDKGAEDWGAPLNENFADLDADVIVKDTFANRPADPAADTWFLATDRRIIYHYDGSTWEAVSGVGTASNALPEQHVEELTTDDQTINQSVTWPDGSTTTTSPSSSGSTNTEAVWAAVNAQLAPNPDLGSWVKNSNNPVLTKQDVNFWPDARVQKPALIKLNNTYHLYYAADDGTANAAIGHATSTDLLDWTQDPDNPILTPSTGWESYRVTQPSVVHLNGTTYLYYRGDTGSDSAQIGVASSTDQSSFARHADNPIISPGASGDWDDQQVQEPGVFWDGGQMLLFYRGDNASSGDEKMGLARAENPLGPFTKESSNPVLSDSVTVNTVASPTIVKAGPRYHCYYTDGASDAYEIHYAYSDPEDPTAWTPHRTNPIITRDAGAWDALQVRDLTMIPDGNGYTALYDGHDDDAAETNEIGLVTMDLPAPVSDPLPSQPGTLIEGFERTTPLNAYAGDTGVFSEETSIVANGSKALSGAGGGATNAISRTDISVQQGDTLYVQLYANNNNNNGGLLFGVQSAAGWSSMDAYRVNLNADSPTFELARVDNGSSTILDEDTTATIDDVEYKNVEVAWQTDGTITATLKDAGGGQEAQLSATDTNYTSGGVGWFAYRDIIADNLRRA